MQNAFNIFFQNILKDFKTIPIQNVYIIQYCP
jgi:hypothetical protein